MAGGGPPRAMPTTPPRLLDDAELGELPGTDGRPDGPDIPILPTAADSPAEETTG
jgi:hypothetical protein